MSARLHPRSAMARVLWYLREVMGENAYGHYLEHQRRTHPEAPVLPVASSSAVASMPWRSGPGPAAAETGPAQATQVVSHGRHHHSFLRLVSVPSFSGL